MNVNKRVLLKAEIRYDRTILKIKIGVKVGFEIKKFAFFD